MAGHEVCILHQIGGEDGLIAEAQMAAGNAKGLLGVILKISLGIHIGVVANDLDGVLIGANSTVASKAPELTVHHLLMAQRQGWADRQRAVSHVVLNAHGEAVEGLLCQQMVEHGLDLGRSGVLGGEAVTSAADVGSVLAVGISCTDSQIQRIAGGAHFLAAIQNGDLLHRCGQGLQEVFGGERIEQVDLQITDLLALCVQIGNSLTGRTADRTHRHDDPFGVRRAIIIEEVVVLAGDGVDFCHVVLDHIRQFIIETVVGFTELEVDIRVLNRISQGGMVGIQRRFTETADGTPVQNLAELAVGNCTDLLDLVGGAETVKEMDEGNAALDGSQMGHAGQIHDLLHAAGGQHGKTGLAAVHHVAVVAENGHGVGTHGTGCHV